MQHWLLGVSFKNVFIEFQLSFSLKNIFILKYIKMYYSVMTHAGKLGKRNIKKILHHNFLHFYSSLKNPTFFKENVTKMLK